MDKNWLAKANVGIVIPTYQAGAGFKNLLSELAEQTFQPQYRLVMDSESTDDTVQFAKQAGWLTHIVAKADFSHGRTRQQALTILQEQSDLDFIIYMTQDVRIPNKDSLEKLLLAFVDHEVAGAYGRQLPHKDASIYAAVDREFNYPAESFVKSMSDVKKLGIKTAFCSNSFAAYRVTDLVDHGGFSSVDICEDVDLAGRFLLQGKKIAYVAEAEVHHSHEPNLTSQWRRYRDMGRFYKEHFWIKENFGTATSEGIKLVCYQLKRVGKEKGIVGILKILTLDSVKFIAHKFM
ncbi:glycosyltransferase family 2 protein [Selenomonas ruminantium]|uniref:glycosyltransferase family 2 protein n=1 Tax=Selenomonas ruminantium TaxID=971 RepID=UPI00068E408F|nr:glycosyltransferase [Selenomonas ruminantium]